IDYRRAAKLGDRLVIEGWLDRVERARFWCAFHITRPQDNTLIAECHQMLALIEMPAGKLLRLPEHWKKHHKAESREHRDGIPRLQKPPLLYWLIIASYKILGVNEAAARLPVALAVVATVALIFLIGEKLSDYWRGFIAGLIYLSFCGTFLLARIVMPEPL